MSDSIDVQESCLCPHCKEVSVVMIRLTDKLNDYEWLHSVAHCDNVACRKDFVVDASVVITLSTRPIDGDI